MSNFEKARRSKGWIVLLATVVGLGVGGYTYIHRAISEQLYVTNCDTVDYKPDALLKFCADGGVGVWEVEWTQWNKDGAEGTGKYVANDCDPSCVDGKIFTQEVYVKLSKLKKMDNKQAFTYVQVESKDKKVLPLLDSMDDEWSLEMAG